MTPLGTLPTQAYVDAHAPGAIAVTVNGAPRHVPPGTTLAQLVERLGRTPASVATSVNGRFVARESRSAVTLQAGAEVACFEPIVGG